jgi:outer membrane immunogenic protein
MTAVFSASEIKTQLSQVPRRCAFAVLAVALVTGTPFLAHAQSASDSAQVMETIKKLEARVAALEGEYRRAKQDAAEARAEVQALRRKEAVASAAGNKPAPTAATTPPTNTAALMHTADAPAGLYSMSTKAPQLPSDPGWGGFYAGTAFGLDAVHARESFSEIQNTAYTNTESVLTTSSVGTDISSQTFSGQNLGAVSSLSLGYNYMIDNKDIIGAQVDGGLADTHVNLKGSGMTTGTSTTVNTPGGTSVGTSITTNTSVNDLIENHWLVSALLRGGRVVDPNDYVYLLGGYTYGRFQAEGEGFGLSGGTVGAGWERQVVPGWTLKAEYRYTRFQNKDLFFSNQNSITQSSSGGTSSSQSNTYAEVSHFSDLDMHSVWLGVSHYFGSY